MLATSSIEDPMTEWVDIFPSQRNNLVRFAESYAHRTCEAEDVVQDVFVRLLRPGGAAVPERPGAYLRRAVANECVSHWRRRQRERLTADIPDWSAVPDSADASTDRIVVRTAVAKLPLRMRQVIALSFLEGMSDADVAQALGISSVTVRTTRARALRHLAPLLADLRPHRRSQPLPSAAQQRPAVTRAASVADTEALPVADEALPAAA
jgi:RNA polymerase sigma factor (sigma-70 family)